MDYNRHFRIENMVYSIDYFQVDFGLGGIYDDVVEMLRASFDLQSCQMFGKLDCDSGIKHLSRYDLYWWQYGGLHVELWPKSVYQKCGSFREDDEGEQIQNDVTLKGVSWFLRFKFNPNKNKDNPVLKTVLSFLLENGWVCGWSFSRVDYALDVEGPIKDFYVLSRKRETNYGSTRYYGVRGSSGYLRVYDKRREQREVFKEDIGYELTRGNSVVIETSTLHLTNSPAWTSPALMVRLGACSTLRQRISMLLFWSLRRILAQK